MSFCVLPPGLFPTVVFEMGFEGACFMSSHQQFGDGDLCGFVRGFYFVSIVLMHLTRDYNSTISFPVLRISKWRTKIAYPISFMKHNQHIIRYGRAMYFAFLTRLQGGIEAPSFVLIKPKCNKENYIWASSGQHNDDTGGKHAGNTTSLPRCSGLSA